MNNNPFSEFTNFLLSSTNSLKAVFCNEKTAKQKLSTLYTYFLLTYRYLFFICLLQIPIKKERLFNFSVSFPDYKTFYYLFIEIFIHQEYAFNSVTDSPVIIDCGSNIGLSVLYFKKKFPKSKITCFEPNSVIFGYLKDNVILNKLENVELCQAALYKKDGQIDLNFDPQSLSFTGTSVKLLSKSAKVCTEKTKSVLLSAYIRGPVDFLKMDIEGAEAEVLEEVSGSSNIKYIRKLAVEYHYNPLTNPENKLGAILGIFEENGFRYTIYSPHKPPLYERMDKPYNLLIYIYK